MFNPLDFSCALVGDILLQGHLYITDKHFAFYSNVFGYITKVSINDNLSLGVTLSVTPKLNSVTKNKIKNE